MKPANQIVIALYGSSNKGKTTTLKKVIDKLGSKYKVSDARKEPSTANDKLVIVNIDGVKVGISTGGDNKAIVKECINELFKNNCSIIVTATRSRGATLKVVDEFSKKNKYKKDWIMKSSTLKNGIAPEEFDKRNKKYNKTDSEIVYDAIFYHLG